MYSEDNLVVIFGGFYIEMVVFKVFGKWLDGSGWKEAFMKVEVVFEGVVELFIFVSYFVRI